MDKNVDTVPIITPSEPTVDVYAAGYIYNSDGIDIAVCWKNSELMELTDGKLNSRANDVFVYGNDVYVCGYISTTDGRNAVIWKNGKEIKVNNQSEYASAPNAYIEFSYASALFVDSSDVYVCGYRDGGICIWKNGQLTTIDSDSAISTLATDVYVEDGEVYVSYYKSYDNINSTSMLWHDGENIALTDGTHQSRANKLALDHGDVYVIGYEYNNNIYTPKLWHNGVETRIYDGTNLCRFEGIFLKDGNVHICGTEFKNEHGRIKYWKNDVATYFTDGTNNSIAKDIFVYNDDVYIGGELNGVLTYWKNGQAFQLRDAHDGVINAIYVAQKSIK